MNSDLTQSDQWYYESRGNRNGPVSLGEIKDLIKELIINSSTLVWKSGFPNWIELEKTELKDLLGKDTPPPLTGNKVNNTYVWILAFSPVIGVFLQYFIASSFVDTGSPLELQNAATSLWWISTLLNILLCILDAKKLKAAGHNTDRINFFWIFLVPVYLFRRARLLQQKPIYAWVWLVAFVCMVLS